MGLTAPARTAIPATTTVENLIIVPPPTGPRDVGPCPLYGACGETYVNR